VLVRSAFSLGGLGSGFAVDEGELKSIVSKALSASPQVTIVAYCIFSLFVVGKDAERREFASILSRALFEEAYRWTSEAPKQGTYSE